MLTHLGQKSKSILLKIFNVSWKCGSLPHCWREADTIPVYKKGKDKNKAESDHPISLTSCVDKLMEHLVNTRLIWHLEEKQLFSPKQADFRQYRSMEDQITYITQEIEDAFQDKKKITVWVDMEKAFDKVWKVGLKYKLQQYGVSDRMFNLVSQYLHNLKARTSLNGHKSRKKLLKQCLPKEECFHQLFS
jgi:hypothetical protein